MPHLAPVVEQRAAESAGVLELELRARVPGEGVGPHVRGQILQSAVLPLREGQLSPSAAGGFYFERGGECEAEGLAAHGERDARVYPRLGIGHFKMQVHFSPFCLG